MTHPIAALLFAAMLTGSPAVAAGDVIDVWLSPWLGVDHPSDVPAMLDRPFHLRPWEAAPIVHRPSRPGDQRQVATCNALFEALADGYLGGAAYTPLHDCRILAWLAKARPARQSFVAGFKFDRNTPQVLPAAFMYAFNCRIRSHIYLADKNRRSWAAFAAGFDRFRETADFWPWRNGRGGRFFVETNPARMWRGQVPHFLTAEALPPGPKRAFIHGRYTSHLAEILARADFNDDGMEDLLIAIDKRVQDAFLGERDVLALTRESPDGVLHLLDIEKYVARGCSEYFWRSYAELADLPAYPREPWRP